MSQPAASLTVALFDQAICIKIAGRANFTHANDLKKLVSELGQRGCAHFVLDLSECVNMDSTFFGVLAEIGLKYEKPAATEKNVELVNPSERLRESLESLGIDHLFKISTQAGPITEKLELTALPGQTSDRAEVTRTCLDAHNLLMKLHPDNVRKFKDVVAFLSEDLRKIESERASNHPFQTGGH